MKKIRNVIAFTLFFMMIAGILTACHFKTSKKLETQDDFTQAKIGVMTGSSFDMLAKEYFPEAEKLYYMNMTDLILNLKQEKIDGILMDLGFFTPLVWEGEAELLVEFGYPTQRFVLSSKTGGNINE